MNCPTCGYENRPNARFCHRCGASLPATADYATKQLPRPAVVHSNLPETGPLPDLSSAFAPLPEGALLRQGRYAVIGIVAAQNGANAYVVEDAVPVRLCANCHAAVANPDERFCDSCGAELTGNEFLRLRYSARENANPQAFTTQAQLLQMQLAHAGLLLPHDTFVEAPYGPPRSYLIEAESSPPLATSLPTPQELNKVLTWGITLAQAMAYLHRHRVAIRDVTLDHVALDNKQAYWRQWYTAAVIPPDAEPDAADVFAQDVTGLANVLFYLAVGQPQQAAPVALPEPVKKLFAHALSTPGKFATAAEFAAALEAVLQEIRRPTSVNLVAGRRTDVGQVRSLNEDSMLTVETSAVYRSVSVPVGLYVVADGMGGHDAGDVASSLTVRTIAQVTAQEIQIPAATGQPLPEPGDWLKKAAQAANHTVYEEGRAASSDMGNTLVMALMVGDMATIANVGDSRAYLLSPTGITQITVDHSLVERLVATGQITREEAHVHPQRNVVYRVIGDKPRVDADIFERRLAPGEALLLCSDGLSGMVPDEETWRIWRASASPQAACDRLVEAANQAGGEDNITVIIVQVAA